jgi:AsmA-like C-terminal region
MSNLPPVSNGQIPEKNAPKKRSFLGRFFLSMGILLLTVILLLVIVATFFQKQLSDQLIVAIGKNLKTKPQIGDISLSFLKDFPEASITLKDVAIKDISNASLLKAAEISFHFSPFSLLRSKIKIQSMLVKDGNLHLRTNKDGVAQYEIMKDNPKSKSKPQSEENLDLVLQNATLENIEFLYENKQTQQSALLHLNNTSLSGDFSNNKYSLTNQADFVIKALDIEGSTYLAGEKVNYDAVIQVDAAQDLYNLQGVEATLGGNTFAIDGIVVSKPDYTDINLKLTSKEGDISMVVNLLPDEYHAYFSDFESTGTYSCGGSIKGRLGKDLHPTVIFDVSLRDGKITSDKLQSPIQNVTFKASYTAQQDGLSNFDINHFKGVFGGKPLNFDLKVINLDDPTVDFKFNGTVPMEAAYGLFDNPMIASGDGDINISALNVSGKYADMASMNTISKVNLSGAMQFQAATIVYNGKPVTFKEGNIRFEDNLFFSDNMKMTVSESDFLLNGKAKNLLPFLFADSLNTKDALLEFYANMTTQNLDIDQLLTLFTVPETGDKADNTKTRGGATRIDSARIAQTIERKNTTDKLKGIFEATIQNFNYDKVTGKNFKGKLGFDHNVLLISGNTETMGGKINVEGDYHLDKNPSLKMRCNVAGLDLKTCLDQCDNFGQEVILSKNIKGVLEGKVAVSAFWDDKGNFLSEKTTALADVTGKNGELSGVKMFEDFSTFIHIEDLKKVKFTQMQNFFELKKRTLTLPAMLIQNNACNMTVSGTHTFDNKIDYKVKVNAGQVLLNRIKKHDNDLDPLPEGNGLFNMYYVIKGTLDDDKYEMKRSKKTVKADFDRSENQKLGISSRLDYEFKNVLVFPEIADFSAPLPPTNTIF